MNESANSAEGNCFGLPVLKSDAIINDSEDGQWNDRMRGGVIGYDAHLDG